MRWTKRLTPLALGGAFLLGGLAVAGEVAPKAEDIRPLLIGAKVPDSTLRAADGSELELAALIKKQPTVLIFYRGGW